MVCVTYIAMAVILQWHETSILRTYGNSYMFILFQKEVQDIVLYHCDFVLDADSLPTSVQSVTTLRGLIQKRQQKKGRNPVVVQCL